jgi:hypothetical protein
MSVGNGQTALFWDDRWISGSSISEMHHNSMPAHQKDGGK